MFFLYSQKYRGARMKKVNPCNLHFFSTVQKLSFTGKINITIKQRNTDLFSLPLFRIDLLDCFMDS